jgi:hypothetical protein
MNQISSEQRHEIVRQIGTGVILSISGGRIAALADGIELPVSNGYRVRVQLTAADDYTVQRIFTRNGREFDHGERTGIYCDQISETAYRAGMFRSYDAGEW